MLYYVGGESRSFAQRSIKDARSTTFIVNLKRNFVFTESTRIYGSIVSMAVIIKPFFVKRIKVSI